MTQLIDFDLDRDQVNISAFWTLYRCDYVLCSKDRNELWDALSKEVFMGTTAQSVCELIEAYIFKECKEHDTIHCD
jgi:hypothetical protein